MRNKIIEEDLVRIIEGSDLPWSDFKNKTVLITGANGFLPAYMVETLLFLNENRSTNKTKVIGLVRNREKASLRFAHYQKRSDFKLITQDVCDPVSFDEKIRIDYIVHAASQASPKYYSIDPVGTLKANVLGTYHLLDMARKKKVKGFLFFSSGAVYGHVDDQNIPIKEDYLGYLDPTNVASCYAESKRMGETMSVSWHNQYGVPAKIVRPFHAYGPGMDLSDGRVFASFVSDIVHDQDIILNSDGSATRAFCYISDAVAGFFTVLLNGDGGQSYNVGNDKTEITILELAQRLVALFPEKELKIHTCVDNLPSGSRMSPVKRRCPDITKINQLGWRPEVGIEEGFERTIRSYL